MTFNFDEIIDREHTSSTKQWKYRGRDVLPLWVADMDFRSPPAVVDAVVDRARHGVYGYTEAPEALVELIIARLARLYDWHVDPRHLVFLPGVVTGLNMACRAVGQAGEAVITSVPIYPPFMSAPQYSGREVLKVEARRDGRGRWELDLDALEAAASRKDARLLLLCNPYNPVGRVLERTELERIAEICLRHDVVVCSDEIHCDLLFDGRRHLPTATIGPEVASRCITLMAPSKTFNLAGFGGSFAVIEDEKLRRLFRREQRGIVPNVNIMAYESMLAAYRDGEDWYQALMSYLQANRDFLARGIEALPGIRMNQVEATYLAWLDVSALGLDDPPAFFEAAGIGMSEGYRFGDQRFMRLNFGCARSVLVEALARFERAIASIG